MIYPQYAEIKGKKYELNTDYRVALRCFEVIDDESICDEERAMAVIYLLFGIVPTEDVDEFLRIAGNYLRCGQEDDQPTSAEKDMDFNYDEKYIIASFMSDYRIDLPSVDMHFWKYIQLMQGLTEKCALSRVRELRNFDLNEIKDPKERRKMAEAKKSVELPHKRTQEEQDAIDEFESLFGG